MSATKIDMEVNGIEVGFNVTPADFNAFINEMQPTNKVAPAHNFLTRTVDPASQENLKEIMQLPGAGLELAGAVVEQYKPSVNITVGKRRPSAKG